nr:MAG TPA: hypothetical protein [Bacteriophage sp.]
MLCNLLFTIYYILKGCILTSYATFIYSFVIDFSQPLRGIKSL